MRVVAIPAVLLLALGALAFVPPAAADAPPHCAGYDTVGVITVVVRATGDSDCTQHVYLIPGTYCDGRLDGTVHERFGLVDLWVPHCGPDLGNCITDGTCDPPFGAAAATPDTYPPCQFCAPPQCDPASVGTGDAWNALSHLFGFVYGGPNVEASVDEDCHTAVDEGGLQCPSSLLPVADDHADEHVGAWVSASADTCTVGFICACMPASAAPTAIPPCQCPPIAPLCQPINRAIAPGDQGPVTYTLSDYCRLRIIIDASGGCGDFGTEWTNKTVNPVEVDYHHCQSPPPQAATSPASVDPFPECLRDCLPVPGNCDLRDATPAAGPSVGPITPIALRQAVWGNDCYIDVDPIGACAPPSGATITRTIGPVRLTLLVCDGGIPPAVA